MIIDDPYFQVVVQAATPNPQKLIYCAMHQDYSENFVNIDDVQYSESKCGEIAVQRLLSGNRGHFGCLEHPQITFSCGWFPHSVIQQARTHRVGISFDVQSYRYTSNHVLGIVTKLESDDVMDSIDVLDWIERAFYLRPPGVYHDRVGHDYAYTHSDRARDLDWLILAAKQYKRDIDAGMSEEHARGKLPFDYRQHFIVSFNLRSLMHFCDLRLKKDAQLEIQQLAELMWQCAESWCPEICAWYNRYRKGRAILAP